MDFPTRSWPTVPLAGSPSLLSAKRIILKGDIASPINPPSSRRFRTRCLKALTPRRGDFPQQGVDSAG